MKAKYKMTGCARFIIFLLFLVPIAYFGSKYLRDSGMWDDIKSKVENQDRNSVDRTIEEKGSESTSYENNDRIRDALESQEEVIENQRIKIEELEAELESLKNQINENTRTSEASIPSSGEESSLDNGTNSDNPSLSELLKEADNNIGTSNTTQQNPPSIQAKNLGRWDFSYSNMIGQVEFFEQNGRLFSRTMVDGVSEVITDELRKSGDRFDVIGSQTGEYYILQINGDLTAYDRNGFQTTCTRASN